MEACTLPLPIGTSQRSAKASSVQDEFGLGEALWATLSDLPWWVRERTPEGRRQDYKQLSWWRSMVH